jgi:hypothetical protein
MTARQPYLGHELRWPYFAQVRLFFPDELLSIVINCFAKRSKNEKLAGV